MPPKSVPRKAKTATATHKAQTAVLKAAADKEKKKKEEKRKKQKEKAEAEQKALDDAVRRAEAERRAASEAGGPQDSHRHRLSAVPIHGIRLECAEELKLPLQRQNDEYLVNCFRSVYASHDSLLRLNRVRVSLQALTLADVTSGDGTTIRQSMIAARPDQWKSRYLHMVRQG